jgi:glutamate-1-semialdehyde 2,1-aminomutase
MTAGLVTIRTLLEPGLFDGIQANTARLVEGIRSAAEQAGIPIQANCAGTMFGFYFLSEPEAQIVDYASAKALADAECYGRFFHAVLERGVYFAPSQFEAGFMSSAHSGVDIDHTLSVIADVMAGL